MGSLRILLILFFVGFSSTTIAQNISNEGTEFWTVFPSHLPQRNEDLATMNVNVTSKFDTEVTVSCGNTSEKKAVKANTVVTFLVDRPSSYINLADGNRNLINRGIHIVVSPGMPKIVAYSHVFAAARSAATLILPVEALGQQYFSMNYNQDNTGQNFLTVVAVENNTDLILHKKDGTTLAINGLNKGDVYQHILPSVDLTGSYIETAPNSICKKFAAFSGSSGLRIGGNTGGLDPLLQQLYSVDSWGKTYGVVPFVDRRYIVRALAKENNTTISFNGIPSSPINKGEFIEREMIDATIVSSDKLISVAQYSYTQNYSSTSGTALNTGDPEMVLLNPIEFNIRNITLFSSDQEDIVEKYLNVFMKTDKTSSFKINGMPPSNTNWRPMPSDPSYSYLQTIVFDESLTLTANDGFNAIAYGFGSYESYAYSAGTNLAASQFLLLVNKVTNVENIAACIGQAADFKLTLPYELEEIVWSFDDGTPDFTDDKPIPIISGTNTLLYTYSAPVNRTYTELGSVRVVANATLAATAGICYSKEVELIFNFNVDPLPVAKIEAPLTGCAGQSVQFNDKSNAVVAGKIITAWKWDFGDGTPILTEQNPQHVFATDGNYTVKLTVSAENGCFSETVEHNIYINTKATPAFKTSAITCLNKEIDFTDQSTITGGNIVKWNWDFGDVGSANNTSNLQNPKHQFSKAGIFEVSLTVETDKGCMYAVMVPVTVNDLPKVDFLLPDICLADAEAVFINKSTDFDGAEVGLQYLWDFGDPSSGALNTSTAKDGKHKYLTAGNYNITLTVTNANGCKVTSSLIPFTVNGSNPHADFEVLNKDNLCSNTTFKLKNISTVTPGNITKIQWFLDDVQYGNDDLEPVFGKEYEFDVPKFTFPLTKKVMVRMIAFSGITCYEEIEKEITLLASPEVEFNELTSICINKGNVQFIATENGGFIGSGVFTGNGVSNSGLFNPVVAGLGVHTITYTFTASNGCFDQKTQTIEVFAVPEVNAGSDFVVLSGGEKQIDATATGLGLTYEWSPADGLSNAVVLRPIAKPLVDTKYTLKVTSSQGCFEYDDVYVKVLQDVEVSNTFSPNGDGINDLWSIKYLDTYPNSTVEVYNRNGQRVYLSNKGYANPFDGNFNKKALPIGTYYYIIHPNSGRSKITGSLTIIR